jgi:CIC family chloride channel protein
VRPPLVVRTRLRLRRILRNDHLLLAALALIVGAASAYGTFLFRLGIDFLQEASFGFALNETMPTTDVLAWWHIILVPTLGGLFVGLFLHFANGGERAHTIAQVIEASALRGGQITPRAGLTSFVAHGVSLAVGSSGGREGPLVHFGAALGSWTSNRLHLSRTQSRTLLGCGVAAAIGSLFNAPVAGAVFAIEVVVGNLSLAAAAPIFVAAVTGTAIGRFYFGSEPSFTVPHHELISLWEFPAFMLLGVVCAVVAIAFMRTVFVVDDAVSRTRIPVWLRPMLGGLLLGVIALKVPEILGVGFLTTDAALRGEFALELLVLLIAAKFAAVAISVGFGFGGGVFSPSLFLGATVGGAFGFVAGGVFPDLFSGVPAYALIGTGALAGAVMGAPLSTIFIMFELTGSSELTVAVMIATAMASVLTTQFYGRSFFHLQLARRGVVVSGGHEQALLQSMPVSRIMHSNLVSVAGDTPIELLNAKLHESPNGEIYVIDEDGALLGAITYADLNNAILSRDEDGGPKLAVDIAHSLGGIVTLSNTVEDARRLIESADGQEIAVVASRETMLLRGIVTALDVSRAHNDALLQVRAEEHA